LTGEKLAEEQVEDVVGGVLAERNLPQTLFTMCGVQTENTDERPKYVLVVEASEPLSREECESFAVDLDCKFRAVNSRYELKRSFGDLSPLEVRAVSRGTFDRHRASLVQRGMPAGQLKDKVLHREGRKTLSEMLALSQQLA
jgi:hypothetical protein